MNTVDEAENPAEVGLSLKAAMRRMPSAVSLITTRDENGHAVGLAASAVMSASLEPPTMFVSINRTASAHGAIDQSGRFCINILSVDQQDMVVPFSNSQLREHRFKHQSWNNCSELPYLQEACANIFCTVFHKISIGTHDLFVGLVFDVRTNITAEPLGWLEGSFARITKQVL